MILGPLCLDSDCMICESYVLIFFWIASRFFSYLF